MLIINPRNDGEGAYEAELHIKIPPEADYTGVERNNKVKENQNVSDKKSPPFRIFHPIASSKEVPLMEEGSIDSQLSLLTQSRLKISYVTRSWEGQEHSVQSAQVQLLAINLVII